MNERKGLGRITATAFIASMIGATLFVVWIMLFYAMQAKSGARVNTAILFALFGFPYAWVVAAFTAWPVGTAIGWAVSRSSPGTGMNAAAGGSLTGIVLIAAMALFDGRSPSQVSPMEWLFLPGFSVLGAVSGWLAWRWVLRPRKAS